MKEFYDYFSKLYEEDIESMKKNKISYKEWLNTKYPNYQNAIKLNNYFISLGASLIIAGIPISIVTHQLDFILISLVGLYMSLYSLANKNDKENSFLDEYFVPKEEILEKYENDIHNMIELTVNSEKKRDFEFSICAFESKIEKLMEQFEIFVFLNDKYEKNMLYIFLKNLIDENILENYNNYYDLFISVADNTFAKCVYGNKNIFLDDFINEIYKLEEDNLLLKSRIAIFNSIMHEKKKTENSCNIINIDRKK